MVINMILLLYVSVYALTMSNKNKKLCNPQTQVKEIVSNKTGKIAKITKQKSKFKIKILKIAKV